MLPNFGSPSKHLEVVRPSPIFFFADDLVLFANADPENYATINSMLQDFCVRSRQKVSEAKSHVFFSPNVDQDQREALIDIMGFNSTTNLGKYLGFPLKTPKEAKTRFQLRVR